MQALKQAILDQMLTHANTLKIEERFYAKNMNRKTNLFYTYNKPAPITKVAEFFNKYDSPFNTFQAYDFIDNKSNKLLITNGDTLLTIRI